MENAIRTASGTFYSGMTLDQAKAIKRDRCIFRRDFGNLDTDKDGVLSDFEILNERKLEAKKKKDSLFLWGGIALLDTIAVASKIMKFSFFDVIFDSIFIISCIKDRVDAKKIESENIEIEKRLNAMV